MGFPSLCTFITLYANNFLLINICFTFGCSAYELYSLYPAACLPISMLTYFLSLNKKKKNLTTNIKPTYCILRKSLKAIITTYNKKQKKELL